ncbi:hypothetical protein ACH5RR_032711 [Cinchona calisaya]|uniref:F-box domain-containing protein n=1 Tax=Cinchona calisaya TaxID=153742 RepID=A0ABD2YIU9_9GENT
MMHIPSEVYEKILVRLEVKDLLRFKCVCRCWADIISSSFFVHRQLEQSKEDPDQNHRRIFLIFPHVTIPYNSCDDKEDSKSNRISKKIPLPRQFSRDDLKIMGSCDGLICLLSKGYYVFLWNPSSRKVEELSQPSYGCANFYWFGRDSTIDGTNYKLIVGVSGDRFDDRRTNTLYVWSSNTNTDRSSYRWTEMGETVYISKVFEDRGTFLNGIVHWPTYEPNMPNRLDFVVSYDLSRCEIRRLHAPAVIQGGIVNSCYTLGVLDGRLCTICKPIKKFEIWMMKEYGRNESWVRMVRLKEFEPNLKLLRPICFLKNGELIADVDRRKLVRYNFVTKTVQIVKTHNNHPMSDVITYLESLISPRDIIQRPPPTTKSNQKDLRQLIGNLRTIRLAPRNKR